MNINIRDLKIWPDQIINTSPRIWLDQTVNTSPIDLALLAVGHTALGLIIGFALFG